MWIPAVIFIVQLYANAIYLSRAVGDEERELTAGPAPAAPPAVAA